MRYLFWLSMLLFFLGFLFFRPVPIVAEERALVIEGTVFAIREGVENDVHIKLKETPTRFYINRGLENGLNLDTLRKHLLGKKATIKYPKYWTPLDWNNEIRHISKLETKDTIWFNELK